MQFFMANICGFAMVIWKKSTVQGISVPVLCIVSQIDIGVLLPTRERSGL